jgi:hypothetical protein
MRNAFTTQPQIFQSPLFSREIFLAIFLMASVSVLQTPTVVPDGFPSVERDVDLYSICLRLATSSNQLSGIFRSGRLREGTTEKRVLIQVEIPIKNRRQLDWNNGDDWIVDLHTP